METLALALLQLLQAHARLLILIFQQRKKKLNVTSKSRQQCRIDARTRHTWKDNNEKLK